MEKRPALLSNKPSQPVPSRVATGSASSLGKWFRPVRRIDLAVFVFLLVVWAMQIGLYQRVESYQEDSSCYIGLAHSLITTGRYEFNFKSHTEHPPGLPIILGATSLLFGGTYDADVRVVATLGVFGLFLGYLLLRKREPPGSLVPAAACLPFSEPRDSVVAGMFSRSLQRPSRTSSSGCAASIPECHSQV